MPTVTHAYCHIFHTCLLSHMPTVTYFTHAYCHICLLSHISHACCRSPSIAHGATHPSRACPVFAFEWSSNSKCERRLWSAKLESLMQLHGQLDVTSAETKPSLLFSIGLLELIIVPIYFFR